MIMATWWTIHDWHEEQHGCRPDTKEDMEIYGLHHYRTSVRPWNIRKHSNCCIIFRILVSQKTH